MSAEPQPDMPPADKRRLQNLSYVISKRTDDVSGRVAGLRAMLAAKHAISPAEAMRCAEELATDYAHLGHGIRDLVRTARTVFREAEARKPPAR